MCALLKCERLRKMYCHVWLVVWANVAESVGVLGLVAVLFVAVWALI